MNKFLCFVLCFVIHAGIFSSHALGQVEVFDNFDDWIAAAGGGTPDLSEDFNQVDEDQFYFVDSGAEVGFLNFTAPGGDSVFHRIDAVPFFLEPGPLDGTPFANLRTAGVMTTTRIDFPAVAAFGFEYLNNNLPGDLTVVLDDEDLSSFVISDPDETLSFFGVVAAEGNTISSILFQSESLLIYTSDNFVAFTSLTEFLLGDVNCDGAIDLLDVAPFVELISSQQFSEKADINQDGAVNLLDVQPFVSLLSGN